MAFIGYSASGYNELVSEIRSRKAKLIAVLDSFPEVQAAIANSWKGEDATAYCDDLAKTINSTKETITNTYDEMARNFEKTYNDWVKKKKNESN